MAKTKIEWATDVWNPIRTMNARVNGRKNNKIGWHCTKVSRGCERCYAERINMFRGDLVPFDNRKVTWYLDRHVLEQPLHWTKKPRRIFACSMTDLFHPDIPEEMREEVFGVMYRARNHVFVIFTKRPAEMLKYLGDRALYLHPHIWVGVSAEDQPTFSRRVRILNKVPAHKHLVSVEPMVGPITMKDEAWWTKQKLSHLMPKNNPERVIDWVICGAETGRGADHMENRWALVLKAECCEAGIPFFFKRDSMGNRLVENMAWEEEPEWRRCRICGCTESTPCRGGCWWVEKDLCSECGRC